MKREAGFVAALLVMLSGGVRADETRVVVMTSYPQELISRYEAAFENAHPGIDVVLEWRRSDDALQLLESGQGSHVDVYWAPSLDTFVTLAEAGYFAVLPAQPGLPGRVGRLPIDDAAGRFRAFELAGFGIAWSEQWLARSGLPAPQDWTDLLGDRRYAEQLLLPVPSRIGFAPMIYASILQGLGWEAGWRLLNALGAHATLLQRGGDALVGQLANAEQGLALSIDFFPLSAQASGQPVGFHHARRSLYSPAYVAQLRAAPQSQAAQAFIDFVLSMAGQQLLLHHDVRRLPVRPDVYPADAGFNPFAPGLDVPDFDFATAEQQLSLISALFDVQLSEVQAARRSLEQSLDALERHSAAGSADRARVARLRAELQAPLLGEAEAVSVLERMAEDPEAVVLRELPAWRARQAERLLLLQDAVAAEWSAPDAAPTPLAFRNVLPGLAAEQVLAAQRGRALFDQLWVASPSPDPALDGLGPTYNQPGCAACHLRNGRAAPPAGPHERLRGLLVRLSVPGADGSVVPHPVYGDQLQDAAIHGVPAEGRAQLQWLEHEEVLADGSVVRLRRPLPDFTGLAFGALGNATQLSLRVAPALVGMGLLDAVEDATLQALAEAPRPDGISGRVNLVPDLRSGTLRPGRFGWKASLATLEQQTAAAFHGDLGITSALLPSDNCPLAQAACRAAALTATPDLEAQQLADVVFYQSVLAVPMPRAAADPQVQAGRVLFDAAGCQHCHLHALRTGPAALAAMGGQDIAAYTDLLLHDMGEGLADGRPDHAANGREWRTAPLWGLGLVPLVNEHGTLLHDGRARDVLEAILWHGGEAAAARERVRQFSPTERQALLRFVNSL